MTLSLGVKYSTFDQTCDVRQRARVRYWKKMSARSLHVNDRLDGNACYSMFTISLVSGFR